MALTAWTLTARDKQLLPVLTQSRDMTVPLVCRAVFHGADRPRVLDL